MSKTSIATEMSPGHANLGRPVHLVQYQYFSVLQRVDPISSPPTSLTGRSIRHSLSSSALSISHERDQETERNQIIQQVASTWSAYRLLTSRLLAHLGLATAAS